MKSNGDLLLLNEEFDKICLDAVEESADTAWHSLLHNLSNTDLEKLRAIFKRKCEAGLTRDEFLEAICNFYDGPQYSLQANILFDEINERRRETISWNNFLDFVITSTSADTKHRLSLSVSSIDGVAHTANESVSKIVLIETEQYFCYAIILNHGRVGLYDGNLNFLTSYHAIMTREDLTRPESERRRRNRWITDAIFCPDTLLLIMTNTARTIAIYEASGLKHVPYWLILGIPNILECLSYKPFNKLDYISYSNSILFSGDRDGEIMSFTFLQPKSGLLRRKKTDDVTLFYWNDFLKEKDHVIVKNYGKVHGDSVKQIKYFDELRLLLSCSHDPNASVVLKHIENKRRTAFYKVPKGITCFALNVSSKVLITGSAGGIIRLWNSYISKPIALLSEHNAEIADIQILESQNLFLSCFIDGILKLWDLQEHTCLQTITLKFPSFRIHGKIIEWGVSCISPGPKRKRPDASRRDDNKMECFGIRDINEMRVEMNDTRKKTSANVWERSCILVQCCNYIATLRTSFTDADIEFGFTYPILPPPPLQNSVLIPSNWGLQSETTNVDNISIRTENLMGKVDAKKQLEGLKFILDKNILEEDGTKSDINYKIAILESKKERMRSKVALGSPYLALDLHDIQELKLSEDLPIRDNAKSEHYVQKIKVLLEDAARKDDIFSSPDPSSSRSKSSKSSIVDLPF